ncbi:protein C10 [Caerostris extrusa]|uniref:Protein C10 n=1 Tax=Caerostris extrusa TaxID=172846 RepID=A0AAV4Y1L4_CAEEX|nr:protein C10 [Caerostris extrusa]
MSVSPTSMLSIEKAKASLKDIISALSLPDHATKLNEAKNNAGNDMMMYMQLVFPLTTQIQQDVVQNYGFSADREGLLEFTRIIKMLAKENEEIAQMNEDLRSLLIPSMILPYPQTAAN